ncbi:unnamed protein product, partial [Oikopleura dioica]
LLWSQPGVREKCTLAFH